MPAITSTLAIASLIGGGISAFGQMQAGQEQKQQQEYNAQISEQESALIKASAARETSIIGQNQVLNEYRMRKEQAIMTGQQVGGYAKAGVAVGTGSPLNVIADSISASELEISIGKWNAENDIATTKYNAEIGATQKLNEAQMRRRYGTSAARTAGYQSVGTLLTSGTSAYDRLSKEKIGS